MKIPEKWLREYVKTSASAEALADKMVMAGNGVEGVEEIGAQFSGVVVGRVLECAEHPDSDHLHVCQVDVGGEAPLQIVCGAPNVRAGALVAAALVGAKLPGGIEIKEGVLRGVKSQGMLCSGPELEVPEGLYPHIGDKGIIIFEEELEPGADVKPTLGLAGKAIDFEILANRPDCMSVWGMAREAAAVMEAELSLPEVKVTEAGGAFADEARVSVLDDELCLRYCARVIKNVRVAPSPMWLREYLHGAGVRPINNIVDITNFVMLEAGHPMHAFDLAKVRGREIIVRRALPGEELTTLDGKAHKLTPEMLVIADAERATGLAGVMGGEESEITEGTREVLFECAAFDRTNIRLTSRALGIRTESSGRFEKGVCPDSALEALERACMLVNELGAGEVVSGAFDRYTSPLAPRTIVADVEKINERISAKLSGEEMCGYLRRLGIEAEVDGERLTAIAPPRRQDIETDADISEEILRLYGYDHIPSTLMKGAAMPGTRGERLTNLATVKSAMVAQGFYEIMNYSFVSPAWLKAIGLKEGDARLDPVRVRNPLGEDTSVMRTSLLPSMLNSLALNLNRGNAEARLFECARAFFKGGAGELPDERLTLTVGMAGEKCDFYAMKAAICALCAKFGVRIACEAGGDEAFHPGRKARITADGAVLGQFGEAHPDVAGNFSIDKRVYIAEIYLDELYKAERPIGAVRALPKFPAVARDIALEMNEDVPLGALAEAIRLAGGALVEDVKLFDIYRGEQLGEGKKSAAFTISLRAEDRTLTESDITPAMERIISECAKQGAIIRG